MKQVIFPSPVSANLQKADEIKATSIRTLLPQEQRQVAGGDVCNPHTGVCTDPHK